MVISQRRLVINSNTLISFGIACFYLVVARNGDLSGRVGLSLLLYGGCLLIAMIGALLNRRSVNPGKFIWLISLVPFLYSSPIWLDAALFAIGIVFIVFLEFRTDDLNALYRFIVLVAIVNAVCVFIQAADKSFFDGFARAWFPEGMYQQYYKTLQSDYYLNGCNAIAGDTAGYILNCIGLLFAVYLIRADSVHRKRNVLIFVICFISMILTGKRGILLCSMIAMIIIYIISGRSSQKFKRFLIALLALIALLLSFVIIAGFFSGNNVITRISETISGLILGNDISSGRLRLYGYALLQFRSSPLFGIGWKGFLKLTTTLYDYSSSHYVNNDYLQVLCETGIIGLICIYLPMFIFLIKTIRAYSVVISSQAKFSIKKALGFSLFIQLFFLSYSFFEIPLYDRSFFFMYIIAVSMGYCALNEFKTSKLNSV